MTAEIGRVLGGRYRLLAPIGMGASAQVYLADDVRLRRRVAVKMLHDALAGDAEFLRRFRAEARAAAALSHPNVLAVYDWGDDEVAFIVTEYLGGGSLRALLDRGELLSPSQALGVGLEATRALDYAHRRGFVHRDIKPANLLFGEEQRLRIADFGLARALAEAAWTEPQGAMFGTARYASPEQAKGEKLNGKADVYALALVMVEAVTGVVPFAADTTIGTLMARVDKQLEVSEDLGPLQAVLTRAGHPDPELRIDARALAAGLLRAAKALSKPIGLPLAGALPRAGELVVDADPTVHGPVTEPEAEPDLTAEDLDLDPPDWVNQTSAPGVGGAGSAGHAAAATVAGEVDDRDEAGDAHDEDGDADVRDDEAGDDEAEGAEDEDEARAAGNGAGDRAEGVDPTGEVELANQADPDPDPDPEPETASEIDAEVADRADGGAGTDPGTDPAADPGGGSGAAGSVGAERGRQSVAVIDLRHVPDDSSVRVHDRAWSDEPVPVGAPMDQAGEAASTVRSPDRHLVTADPSAADAPTAVTAAVDTATVGAPGPVEPAGSGDPGEPAEPGRRRRRWPWVLLVIALLAGGGVAAAQVLAEDKPPVPERTLVLPVPALSDRSQESAEAIARAAGWKTTVRSERRDGTLVGQVIGTAPAAGARLEDGGSIELVISAGQTEVEVPADLAGKPLADATALVEFVGLKVVTSETRIDENVPEGSVIGVVGSTPPTLERGSTVEVVVSSGPPPRAVPSDLAGKPLADVTARIEAVGLKAVTSETRFDEDVAEGSVIGVVDPTPPMLEKGSTVRLVVSGGPRPRSVPSVVGGTEADATEEITAQQLEVAVNPQFNPTVPEGEVASQLPRPGTEVQRGATVTIEVSQGPETVAVPDVSGADTPAEAAATLRASGLAPGSVSGSSEGSPAGTSPSRGTEVEPGSTIDILLG